MVWRCGVHAGTPPGPVCAVLTSAEMLLEFNKAEHKQLRNLDFSDVREKQLIGCSAIDWMCMFSF